ncbi:MAG TPA: hypothetical protein VGG19_12225 [Tepidisphaeraceae bacterium]|jgi:hypothetical protein
MSQDASPNPNPRATILHDPIEPAQRRREIECPSCGVSFSISFAFFIHKSDNAEQIFCPNGHAFVPEKSGEIEANADRVILLTELLDARNRIVELERALSEKQLPPGWSRNPEGFVPAAGDIEELKRRARMLRSRTPLTQNITRECKFCGRFVRDSYFVLHNIRRHAVALAEIPAERFSAP